MCELWKAESRPRESLFLFLDSFRTPQPNFLGALIIFHGEPQARFLCDCLENRGLLLPVVLDLRVFGRLIAAYPLACTRCRLDSGCVVKRGLNEEW